MIGLTATPPVSLPEAEAELYDALLGPVDFTVPTPAVVRDGHLAPYQELALLTEPLAVERDWLAEHDTRFRELVTNLHDGDFPEWVIGRLHERRRSADDETELSWPEFQKRSPKLARAGIRFLLSADLRIPPGAPRGEQYRRRPTSTTGSCCWRTTRCASWRAIRRARPPTATRRSPPRCASSASTSPARASAAARPRSTGC